MSNQKNTKLVRGYCAQCDARCPTIAHVENGIFTKVAPDREHPNACALCLKGLAGPEMVYSPARLKFPVKRTKPKSDPDPGWQRISWDEAFDTIAARLKNIKTEFGAESVAFYRPAFAGSPSQDFWDWGQRLANAFGSPNVLATTHICQWARDNATAYTYGTGIQPPEFEKSACILLWGHNPYHTDQAHVRDIERAINNGARLIVIDPRRTQAAKKADVWLQVHPGTDGALALGLLQVMITEDLFDSKFVMEWTDGSFLIRNDTGDRLKQKDINSDASTDNCMAWDKSSQSAKPYDTRTMSFAVENVVPALTGSYNVTLADGKQIICKTAFQCLTELVCQYPPERVEEITGVSADKIREAARMFATVKPASYYTYNGIEQQTNSSQTNRAVCLAYALTGNFDVEGSNRALPRLSVNPVIGLDFLTPEIDSKRLGSAERPLGPPGKLQRTRGRSIRANDLYKAIISGNPYPIKAVVAFGGNILMANPDTATGREALSKLDFFVQAELFMSPPALLADIVLPACSFWETEHVRAGFRHSAKDNCHVQIREAVVPPQHESKSDMEIIFELAKRLGLGNKFWEGNMEAAFSYQIAPLGITVKDLRKQPGGITLPHPSSEKAYSKKNPETGIPIGFNTSSRRIEIYSQLFKDNGYEPLPLYKESIAKTGLSEKIQQEYPLTLTNYKLLEYVHGCGRCLPSLRRRVPEPFVEINPSKAMELGISDGDIVAIETPGAAIRVKAKLTDAVSPGVVCTQHGWWQECQELKLPGYDPYSASGANVNLLYTGKHFDPLSGSYPNRGYPCRVRKL